MQKFYNRALIALLCLVAASVVMGYACFKSTFIRLELLPASESVLAWHAESASDLWQGGHSTVKLLDDPSTLGFDFKVSNAIDHPFAAASLVFRDRSGKNVFVDLSRYSSISFDAKCAPANTLAVGVKVFEDKITRPDNPLTYRVPYAYFFCHDNWGHVEQDLAHLRTDQWWFDMFKLNVSRQAYRLDKVAEISFSSTFQSPYGVASRTQLRNICLNGRDMRYMYVFGVFMVLAWAGYGFWFFRQHSRALVGEVKDKLRRDIPLVAYQQLSGELHRDKEKSAILRFMATEYANADLDVDAMVSAVGINRNKINEVLKAELGFTFSTYLNKLRLTEAARLLDEKDGTSVAEIAYSVGYRNVSYFNKLFKEEYGCTPKTFRTLRQE
jgi:AraC-like DNA-binding protein